MNISAFFIERPIFAAVISIFITLIGAFCYPLLPLAQYPEIAPPTISVQAFYAGAPAETIAETVSAPLEQEINGVEGMLYMSSSSTQGAAQVTVTFKPGTDLDAAQVLVQNRVALAEPRLPEQVRQIGVTVNKQESGFLMIVALTSPNDSLDVDYIGNYANTVIRDRLLRLPGVGTVNVFGGGNYAMRVWIDPDKAASRNLTSTEIIAALRAQNVQVAGGSLGQSPAGADNPSFEVPVDVQGRLTTVEQFGKIAIKTDPAGASITRLSDVARIELGSQDYAIRGSVRRPARHRARDRPAAGRQLAVRRRRVLKEMDTLKKDFPQGLNILDPLQSDRICRGIGRGGAAHFARSGGAGRDRRADLPPDLARRGDPDRRDSDRAGRHLRGAARARLFDQLAVPVRARAGGRYRRR
jgi:multidrug efflux pump subunit AcrB